MKLARLYVCVCLSLVAAQATAGLFNDDEARQKIQLLEARVARQDEDNAKKLAELKLKLQEMNTQLEESSKQQTRALVDLQSQIELQSNEVRQLRGQNEELAHALQDAEKRQKDFYVDLDGRVRRFEAVDVTPVASEAVSGVKSDAVDDPAVENRAYEAAYAFYKAASWQNAVNAMQEFVKKFPDSVYAPQAHYLMAMAYFTLNDYQNSLASYQVLLGKYPAFGKAAEAWLNMAACQQELKDAAGAKKSLRQLVAKYPDSEAANKAKQRLATLK